MAIFKKHNERQPTLRYKKRAGYVWCSGCSAVGKTFSETIARCSCLDDSSKSALIAVIREATSSSIEPDQFIELGYVKSPQDLN